MADDLNAIVQRMIDAGETEENIGTVIQHFRQQPSLPPGPGSLGLTKATGIGPEPTFLERSGAAIGPAIRGVGDVTGGNWLAEKTGLVPAASLSRPEQNARDAATRHTAAVGGLAAGAMELGHGLYRSATTPEGVLNRLRFQPSKILDIKINQPLKTIRDIFPIEPKPDFVSAPGYPQFQTAPPTEMPAAAANAPPVTEEALESARIGKAPVSIGQGSLDLMRERGMLPAASHAPTVEPPHPLSGPRVDIGAEAVGKAQGLSKQAVRDATGPILGEAPGEASPVLPEKPLKRMIDTMKALPKEGSARPDYVAAAKDLKTKAQLENLRRTLAHLGLVGAGAVGSRQALLNGMDEQ